MALPSHCMVFSNVCSFTRLLALAGLQRLLHITLHLQRRRWAQDEETAQGLHCLRICSQESRRVAKIGKLGIQPKN